MALRDDAPAIIERLRVARGALNMADIAREYGMTREAVRQVLASLGETSKTLGTRLPQPHTKTASRRAESDARKDRLKNRNARIVALRESGMSQVQIAAAVGVAQGTVSGILIQADQRSNAVRCDAGRGAKVTP